MNKLKAALSGILIISTMLITGCGSLLDAKPDKPSKITIDGIDITTDTKGSIAASRKGIPFISCDDNCNILRAGLQVDSIKPVRVGKEAAVVIVYQIPIRRPEKERLDSIGGKTELQSLELGIRDPLISGVSTPSRQFPLLASLSMIFAQPMPSIDFMEPAVTCGPTERNWCCTHVHVTDGNTNSLEVPAQEDPDCAAYFD